MKKNSIIGFCLIVTLGFLFACSSSHKIQSNSLNGNWVLNSAALQGADNGTYKTTVFDDVPVSCLNGSAWSLPNSGSGSYTIQGDSADCTAGARQIYWAVRNENGVDYFQFKKIENGVKPKDVEEGYRLEITSVTSTGFSARSPVAMGDKTAYVVYNFTRQ